MTTSERVNTAAGASPALTKTRCSGRVERRAGRDLDHGAVAHEGGVERDRDIVGRHDLAEMRRRPPVAGGQRLRQRADGQPGLERRRGRTVPARRRRRRRRCGGLRSRRAPRRRSWRAPWRRRRAAPRAAWRRASARADRCISTPRRAGAAGRRVSKRVERGLAQRRDRAAPGSARLRRGETSPPARSRPRS